MSEEVWVMTPEPGYYWVQFRGLTGDWGKPQIILLFEGPLGLSVEKFRKRTTTIPLTNYGKNIVFLSRIEEP